MSAGSGSVPTVSRRGPFDPLRATVMVVLVYVLAAGTWLAGGSSLPGGRWLSVHLFTLGVVTNLVLALTDHFGRTLTRQPGLVPAAQLAVTNVGIVAIVLGVPAAEPWLVAGGATIVAAVVFASYRRLRRMRRSAVGPRFGWVVRRYEQAHGAFLHGAVLGALLGIGVLGGSWIPAVRIAHLHVNLLGWAGVTLLATIVLFGPTIARTKIVAGADARAQGALRFAVPALTISVVGLIGTAFPSPAGSIARWAAAAALAVFARAVSVVCVPVIAAMRSSGSPLSWHVGATAAWFIAVAWSDPVIVAMGAWRWVDTVGAAMLVGVLAQAIVASLSYLGPRLLRREPDVALRSTEAWARARATAWNVGVAAIVIAAAFGWTSGVGWATVAMAGWALVLASAVLTAARVIVWPGRSRRVVAGPA